MVFELSHSKGTGSVLNRDQRVTALAGGHVEAVWDRERWQSGTLAMTHQPELTSSSETL